MSRFRRWRTVAYFIFLNEISITKVLFTSKQYVIITLKINNDIEGDLYVAGDDTKIEDRYCMVDKFKIAVFARNSHFKELMCN